MKRSGKLEMLKHPKNSHRPTKLFTTNQNERQSLVLVYNDERIMCVFIEAKEKQHFHSDYYCYYHDYIKLSVGSSR